MMRFCGILWRQFCWKVVIKEKVNLDEILDNVNSGIVKMNKRCLLRRRDNLG